MAKEISRNILDKYLHEDYPCVDAVERLMFRIVPYWNISPRRMRKNLTDVIEATWEFDYISENKPSLPQHKNITASVMQDIKDDSLTGKNISV